MKTTLLSRSRRLRASQAIRSLVAEVQLRPANLIAPFFVREGIDADHPIAALPGHAQKSVSSLVKACETAQRRGIKAVLLFGIPIKKDAVGTGAFAKSGIVQKAVRALKKEFPELVVITDLCFCEFTAHGHCGILTKTRRGLDVDNDKTLALLKRAALSQAEAGADFVAPSGMMDGVVAAVRSALDGKGFSRTGLLAYAAKYSSAFYGPFREAAGSAPKFGNRKTYQMDPANSREAIKEILTDVDEGADMVMVKPALAYMDIIAKARPLLKVPLVAYNVSGEYAMVKAAAQAGWIDGPAAMMEILLSLKRAGADAIVTYHALDAAQILSTSRFA